MSDLSHTNMKPAPGPRKWKALATVALGTVMGTMDASITNIAFPVLTRVFQTELTTVMWVTLAFILVSTSSMLLVGKISDLIGRKRIYAGGTVVFTLGLTACSLAQGVGQLIFFRAFQALGAAMIISCGTAIVTEAFPRGETGKGLGLLGMSVSVGFILGPVLGGFLLDWLDWRSIFYVRIPLGLTTLLMALLLLERDRIRTGAIKLDLMGILTSSGGLFCIVFGVSQIRKYGPASPLVHLLIGFGLLSLIFFFLVERHAADPIVDFSLFKNRVFSSAIWGLFLTFVGAPAYILIMPFYLMQGLALDPSKAGLLLAVTSMSTIVSGPVSGWLSDRFGSARFAALGALLNTAAFAFMLYFDPSTPVTMIIPVLILLGLGVGTFQAPNNSVIMGAVPRERLGTASALIATQRQVGISVGMSLAGTIFSARRLIHQEALIREGLEKTYSGTLSVSLAFHDVLMISIFLGTLVVVLSLFSGGKRSLRTA
jgi:EmrB/QacA subfamily drug resistance transporter